MYAYDIVVIGGGPAGMAAAVAAWDAGCKRIAIFDREAKLGGILQQCIHNGFGLHRLGRELTGPEYAAVYAEMVENRGIKVYTDTTVTAIDNNKQITARNAGGLLKIQAKAIILAMGCRERSRGALNICGTRPAGVYSAGTAQKLINCMGYQVGKKAVILGSGDIGLIMARRLSLEGAKVEAVCEVMPYSGGLTRNIVQCLEDFGIPLYLSTTVIKIHGEKRVEGVTVAQVDGNRQPISGTERYIPCDTLLLSVGLIPENELTHMAGIPMDPITGGALVDENCQTEVAGIYACGNVLQVHDLVDYVSAEAERAGMAAAALVAKNTANKASLSVKAGKGVRYVIPQIICDPEQEVSLFFRVAKPDQKVRLVVSHGENRLAEAKRLRVAPGEMEKLTLKAGTLSAVEGSITVSLEVME